LIIFSLFDARNFGSIRMPFIEYFDFSNFALLGNSRLLASQESAIKIEFGDKNIFIFFIFHHRCALPSISSNVCAIFDFYQDGNTALHWACIYDKLEAAGLLIAMGADANAKNKVSPPYLLDPYSLLVTRWSH